MPKFLVTLTRAAVIETDNKSEAELRMKYLNPIQYDAAHPEQKALAKELAEKETLQVTGPLEE